MGCGLYKNLLSSYIDKDINEIDKNELEKHLTACEECMDEYQLLLNVVKNCNNIEEVELPINFHDELHEKLKASNNKKSIRKYFRFNWKWAAGIAAVFIIAIVSITQLPNLTQKDMAENEEANYRYGIATGSSAPAEAPAEAAEGGAHERENVNFTMDSIQSNDGAANNEDLSMFSIDYDENKKAKETVVEESQFYDRKIIVNGSISLEVIDFDNSMKFITDLVKKYGGYVENSNVDNNSSYYVEGKNKKIKNGNISIRIPSDKFQIVLDEVKAIGEVINENTNSIDISDVYYDTASRIENLKVQESRLRELLVLAKNVEEILKIENELNRVRSDIDLMSTDIKRWDKQVSMSSLYINLREMKDAELSSIDVSTTWGKAYKGFIKAVNNVIRGIESLFIFIVTVLPYIAILTVILSIIYCVMKRIRGKSIK